MPETALLSALFFFFNSNLKVLFWGKLKFLLHLSLKLLFLGIPHTTWTPPFFFVTYGTVQLFFERSFSSYHTSQPDISLAHHIISSAPPPAHSSASSAAQRRAVLFPGVPWRGLPCGAVLCDAVRCGVVRCCAVLCRVTSVLLHMLSFCWITTKMYPQLSSAHNYV